MFVLDIRMEDRDPVPPPLPDAPPPFGGILLFGAEAEAAAALRPRIVGRLRFDLLAEPATATDGAAACCLIPAR